MFGVYHLPTRKVSGKFKTLDDARKERDKLNEPFGFSNGEYITCDLTKIKLMEKIRATF